MFRQSTIPICISLVFVASASGVARQRMNPQDVIAVERAALDRWGKGDPGGFIETYATDITYFDPMQERRIDGLDAMKKMLAPITGKVRVSRYDMIDPKVQAYGEVAVLTYNLISYSKRSDGSEVVASRWNSTAVFRWMDGRWRTIHSHWSFIKPELKAPPS